jgi:hypothetical protein
MPRPNGITGGATVQRIRPVAGSSPTRQPGLVLAAMTMPGLAANTSPAVVGACQRGLPVARSSPVAVERAGTGWLQALPGWARPPPPPGSVRRPPPRRRRAGAAQARRGTDSRPRPSAARRAGPSSRPPPPRSGAGHCSPGYRPQPPAHVRSRARTRSPSAPACATAVGRSVRRRRPRHHHLGRCRTACSPAEGCSGATVPPGNSPYPHWTPCHAVPPGRAASAGNRLHHREHRPPPTPMHQPPVMIAE